MFFIFTYSNKKNKILLDEYLSFFIFKKYKNIMILNNSLFFLYGLKNIYDLIIFNDCSIDFIQKIDNYYSKTKLHYDIIVIIDLKKIDIKKINFYNKKILEIDKQFIINFLKKQNLFVYRKIELFKDIYLIKAFLLFSNLSEKNKIFFYDFFFLEKQFNKQFIFYNFFNNINYFNISFFLKDYYCCLNFFYSLKYFIKVNLINFLSHPNNVLENINRKSILYFFLLNYIKENDINIKYFNNKDIINFLLLKMNKIEQLLFKINEKNYYFLFYKILF
jgi:hypothetical protein